jgi:predicted dehydrogenase
LIVPAMRTVVVGLGRMGLRHLQVVQDLGLDLVGVADQRAEARSDALNQQIPQDRIHSDGLAMIQRERPELVVIATTAPAHCDLVCCAAENGARIILCEKPMAVSIAQCDRMIATCKRMGTRLAVNHQMRFMEQFTAPKDLIESEAIGGFSSQTVIAGNFGMAMNASHYIEAFRFLTGERPVSVAAWFSDEKVINPRGAEFEDRGGALRLLTRSGRRFYLESSPDQGHGVFAVYSGPFGRVEVDEVAGRMRSVARESADRELPSSRIATPSVITEYQIKPVDALTPTRALMEALLANHDYPNGEIGRSVIELLVAAHLSHERGGETITLEGLKLPRDQTFPWA